LNTEKNASLENNVDLVLATQALKEKVPRHVLREEAQERSPGRQINIFQDVSQNHIGVVKTTKDSYCADMSLNFQLFMLDSTDNREMVKMDFQETFLESDKIQWAMSDEEQMRMAVFERS